MPVLFFLKAFYAVVFMLCVWKILPVLSVYRKYGHFPLNTVFWWVMGCNHNLRSEGRKTVILVFENRAAQSSHMSKKWTANKGQTVLASVKCQAWTAVRPLDCNKEEKKQGDMLVLSCTAEESLFPLPAQKPQWLMFLHWCLVVVTA